MKKEDRSGVRGSGNEIIEAEILLPENRSKTLPSKPGNVLARHDPRFYEPISRSGTGSEFNVCGCCFVRKGLRHKGVDHAPDCLSNVPISHQDRWRQGRNDLIDLHENGVAPIDAGKDHYYLLGRGCTERNLAEILRRRKLMIKIEAPD